MFNPADDSDFTYDTEAEADRGLAFAAGYERPDKAWVLTDRDVWYPNPYYTGLPVPHPEDWDAALDGGFEGDYEAFLATYRASLNKPAEVKVQSREADDACPF